MRKLIIHIGTPKTGTTAIQGMLTDNEGFLKEKGYVYLKEYDDMDIRSGLYKSGGNICRVLNTDRSDEEKAGAIVKCLEETDSDVILSAELMWKQLAEDSRFLFCLKEQLKEEWDIRIVVYLRPQYDYYESMYLEWVKYWKEAKGIREDWNTGKTVLMSCDYRKLLAKLESGFGKDKLQIRIYDKCRFEGGDVRMDFLRQLGIVADRDRIIMTDRGNNISLDYISAELLKKLNGTDLSREDIVNYIYPIVIQYLNNNEKSHYRQMTKQEINEFNQRYYEDNRYIAMHYLGREELFDSAKIVDEEGSIGEAPNNMNKLYIDLIESLVNMISRKDHELSEMNNRLDFELSEMSNRLDYELSETTKRLELMYNSNSWKVTGPLRYLKSVITGRATKRENN